MKMFEDIRIRKIKEELEGMFIHDLIKSTRTLESHIDLFLVDELTVTQKEQFSKIQR